jgi:4-amino-4-deoxy-L-arabinose transferase-like glycosyltransferase
MIVEQFRPYRVIILLFILAAFVLRIPILKVRYFDPDEFQHLHGAREIYRGQIPYRDYFEHHTPFLHFILTGFYPIFGEEIRVLFVARALMLAFTAAILYLTYVLAKTLYGTDAGLFAALFLSYVIMFLEKTIEVRPDVRAVVFWLVSLTFMVKGIQRVSSFQQSMPEAQINSRFPLPTLYFMLSGLMIGVAIMFTQKTLFAFGCLIIVLAWMLLDRRLRTLWKQKLKLAGIFRGSMMVPVVLTCLFFYANGGLWEFINCNFIMNSRWRVRFRPYDYIMRLLSQNPFFSVIGLSGLFVGTFRMRKKDEIVKGSAAPVLCTYGLIASLFIIPVPYRQFYLLFLPLLAMYCGSVLGRMTEISIRRTYLALSIAIVIIVYLLVQTVGQLSQKNDGQLANVKYIMNITTEEDTVLDGWSGFGFLRSHAYYYFFLHSEMLAMLSEKEKTDDLINSLEEKRTRVVIYNGSVKTLPKKVQEYISGKYKPSGHGNIWVRAESELATD